MGTSSIGCCFSLGATRKLCWMIHTGCNLRCDHCAVFDNQFVAAHEPVRGSRDIDRVLAFIARHEIGKVVVSGGEPTLSRWCPEVIRRLARAGLETSISTNGTTLSPARVARLRASGLRKATVSLDGATAERHDAVRGVGSFDRAIAGITMLVGAGVTVSVGTFLRSDTADEINALGRRCLGLDVQRLSLFFAVRRGRFEGHAVEMTSLTPAELHAALRPQRIAGLRVTIHEPRCDEHDCPSGTTIFGAIGGEAFQHCVYKSEHSPRLAFDMLAA